MNGGSDRPALNRALGLVVVLGLAGCPSRPRAERGGPFLSMRERESEPRTHAPLAPEAISLALGGLPPEELTRLRERLADSTEAAVRRDAPVLFDLDGLADDGAAPAPDLLREALPDLRAWTAAANVLGAPWTGSGLSVALGAACDPAASRCVPLFAPATDHGDTLVRRGRALAWSLGNAALLRVPAASRVVVVQSLRDAQARPSGTVALVFGAPRGALDDGELERLRDQARLAVRHLAPDAPQRPWLDAVCAARAGWELPVAFDDDEVLVVPRLSALARLQDFHAEVDLAGRLPRPR